MNNTSQQNNNNADLKMNIDRAFQETNSVITLLMGQFNKEHVERADNETIYYGICAVKNGIEAIYSHISMFTEIPAIKASSPVAVMINTIEEMIVNTKAVLELLHDQFANDDNGCLNNETIYTIFASVRKDLTKMVGVSDDFIGMIDKVQA